ncbi:hypothetical protein HH303_03750 [Rhodospirillaceae bacterium KN72]|uniref:Cytochrome c family protein n=1 Tax=Pacificispira spongiicola TaxID=2729598 RepID=A0A7Y0DY33_9PROT|nr:hypothetical protein [Pacificispira spongiicola]NMM43578.1 hypothetical protein [Pacificispira spongiicola]
MTNGLRWMGAVIAFLFLVQTALPQESRAELPAFKERFCFAEPYDRPCAVFPIDQTDFSEFFEYMIVEAKAQEPFDFFSWQAFVALNWPYAAPDRPAPSLSDTGRYAWTYYARRDDVISAARPATDCRDRSDGRGVYTWDLAQADGNVLIDIDGNFAVYETRMNDVAADYIRSNALNTLAGQEKFAPKAVSFPLGGDGRMPSVLMKTAWRILTGKPSDSRYLQADGIVSVPTEASESGEPLCLTVRLGLVGMHIVSRVKSGNGDEWIWSTFEHRDNVPIAENARNINSIYARDLFPGGCKAPKEAQTETASPEGYAFFDPDCPTCATNAASTKRWSWADTAPFARLNGSPPDRASQIVRCWDIFPRTDEINAQWHAALAGSVLTNYQLVSTQWRGANASAMFEHGEVPRYVSNTTLETYLQYDKTGSCLGCHAGAATAAGQSANFTFLLQNAD